MSAPPTPRDLLEALRAHLTPTPIFIKLPSTLQIFAHFQLLSSRIVSEARRAQAAQEAIADEFLSIDLPDEEWAVNGSLELKQSHQLRRWAGRDKSQKMIGLSFEMRKRHLAELMTRPKIPPEAVYPLLDLYFPARPDAEHEDLRIDDGRPKQLYIRMMSEEQWDMLDEYRKVVLGWYEALKRDQAAGRPPPTLASFFGGTVDPLDVLVRNIVKEAEGVVADIEAFTAMFASAAPAVTVKPSGEDMRPTQDRAPRPTAPIPARLRSESPRAVSSARSRQTLPTPPLSSRPHPQDASAPAPTASRYDETQGRRSKKARLSPVELPFGESPSPPRSPDRHLPPASSPRRQASSHARDYTETRAPAATLPAKSRKPAPAAKTAIPDYTKPAAKLGSNVPKADRKPFDQSAIKKRPRPDAEAGNRRAGRESDRAEPSKRPRPDVNGSRKDREAEPEQPASRRVLAKGGRLENSQSSESQGTKERRRIAKGKGRADPDDLDLTMLQLPNFD